jgi:hypothetical protein
MLAIVIMALFTAPFAIFLKIDRSGWSQQSERKSAYRKAKLITAIVEHLEIGKGS